MSRVEAVCLDLYSTLIHESPDNAFYSQIADRLSLPMPEWYPIYRKLGNESMSGD